MSVVSFLLSSIAPLLLLAVIAVVVWWFFFRGKNLTVCPKRSNRIFDPVTDSTDWEYLKDENGNVVYDCEHYEIEKDEKNLNRYAKTTDGEIITVDVDGKKYKVPYYKVRDVNGVRPEHITYTHKIPRYNGEYYDDGTPKPDCIINQDGRPAMTFEQQKDDTGVYKWIRSIKRINHNDERTDVVEEETNAAGTEAGDILAWATETWADKDNYDTFYLPDKSGAVSNGQTRKGNDDGTIGTRDGPKDGNDSGAQITYNPGKPTEPIQQTEHAQKEGVTSGYYTPWDDNGDTVPRWYDRSDSGYIREHNKIVWIRPPMNQIFGSVFTGKKYEDTSWGDGPGKNLHPYWKRRAGWSKYASKTFSWRMDDTNNFPTGKGRYLTGFNFQLNHGSGLAVSYKNKSPGNADNDNTSEVYVALTVKFKDDENIDDFVIVYSRDVGHTKEAKNKAIWPAVAAAMILPFAGQAVLTYALAKSGWQLFQENCVYVLKDFDRNKISELQVTIGFKRNPQTIKEYLTKRHLNMRYRESKVSFIWSDTLPDLTNAELDENGNLKLV